MLRLRPDLSVKLDLPHFVLNSLMAICQCGKAVQNFVFPLQVQVCKSLLVFIAFGYSAARLFLINRSGKIRQGGATMHIGRLDEHLFWGETFSHTRFCEWRTVAESPTGICGCICVCEPLKVNVMLCWPVESTSLSGPLCYSPSLAPFTPCHPAPPLPPAWPAHSCPFSPLWGPWNPGPCSE